MIAKKLLRCLSRAYVLPKGFAVVSGMTYILGHQLGKLHIITGSILRSSDYLQIDTKFITKEFEEEMTKEVDDDTRWYDVKIEYESSTYYLIDIF